MTKAFTYLLLLPLHACAQTPPKDIPPCDTTTIAAKPGPGRATECQIVPSVYPRKPL